MERGLGGEVWRIELTHPKKTTNPVISRQRIDPTKLELAKRFRKEPTEQEAQVWGWLRNRRMKGLKFRRQQVIEGFIADFYCAEYHLAIELDGNIHETEEAKSYDRAREEIFAAKGIRFIRIRNEKCTIDELEDRINKFLTLPPAPSP